MIYAAAFSTFLRHECSMWENCGSALINERRRRGKHRLFEVCGVGLLSRWKTVKDRWPVIALRCL